MIVYYEDLHDIEHNRNETKWKIETDNELTASYAGISGGKWRGNWSITKLNNIALILVFYFFQQFFQSFLEIHKIIINREQSATQLKGTNIEGVPNSLWNWTFLITYASTCKYFYHQGKMSVTEW